MISKELNAHVVNTLKEYIPSNKNLANVIMDILDIEKKTAYRRISSEVSFTFLEVVTLANHFGFSLDEFTSVNKIKNIVFELGILPNSNLKHTSKEDNYTADILCFFNNHYERIRKYSNTSVVSAYNILPPILYLKYPALTKFNMMKWAHKFHTNNNLVYHYNQFTIPESIRSEQLLLVNQAKEIDNNTIIINYLAFKNQILEVEYYRDLGILSAENISEIKSDLHSLLQEIKDITFHKKFDNGNNVNIYISNVHFGSTVVHFESEKSAYIILSVFYINFISAKNKLMIEITKSWLNTLKLSSTLISGTNDIYRHKFFLQQEELINQLGN